MRIPAWEPLPGPVMVWPLRSRVTSLAVIVIQAPVLGFVQRFRFRPYVLGGFGIVNPSSRSGEVVMSKGKVLLPPAGRAGNFQATRTNFYSRLAERGLGRGSSRYRDR